MLSLQLKQFHSWPTFLDIFHLTILIFQWRNFRNIIDFVQLLQKTRNGTWDAIWIWDQTKHLITWTKSTIFLKFLHRNSLVLWSTIFLSVSSVFLSYVPLRWQMSDNGSILLCFILFYNNSILAVILWNNNYMFERTKYKPRHIEWKRLRLPAFSGNLHLNSQIW